MFSYRINVIRDDADVQHNTPLEILCHTVRADQWYHGESHDLFIAMRNYLNDREIPHHYEVLDVVIDDGVRTWDCLTVLHVYDADVAFELRMTFNVTPMREDWREIFLMPKPRPSFWWRPT